MDPAAKAKILVVDDVPEKLLAIEVILEELGQTVICVPSGAEALRRLLNDDFAVILLDVNMPGMDGFETAALIRQRRRSERTPIIFLTAFPDDTHAARGYSLGAVDYILAPVVPEVLRAKVSVFVDLYRMNQEVRRQAEERVSLAQEHAARLAAERANRAKSEFLANVSHELRTPMNAIIGMTDLALEEPLGPQARLYLDTVRSNAHLLLELLNQVLDFSKLEAGKLTFESAPFGLRDLLADVARSVAYHAAQKGLAFSFHVSDAVPDRLTGDSLRVRQILLNLLSNAVKFTQRGEVELSVEEESAMADETRLAFSVRDTGIGIAPEDQARIFSPFTQVDASITRQHGGTGLGLAISSDLVRGMGGEISLRSQMGIGSTFRFSLPFHCERAGAPSQTRFAASAIRPAGDEAGSPAVLDVLLVEDVPANQMLVQHALGKRGHRVHVAHNGREALTLAAERRFHVILMDLQMPEMDGFQATAALRTQPASAKTPIIAMTAHAMAADRDRCLAAGMDAYIAKPIDVRKLVDVVESFAAAMANT